MKVPNDFADIGGDLGERGGSLGRGEGGTPFPENRLSRVLPFGERREGVFGMPWSESGGNSVLFFPPAADESDGERAVRGSMVLCTALYSGRKN